MVVVEECWLKQERSNISEEAPLLCFECPRFKTMKFLHEPEQRDAQIFLNGFRFAIFQFAIQLNKSEPLTNKQMKYIQGMEMQTKCSLDRGVSVKTLEESLQNMIKLIEPFPQEK